MIGVIVVMMTILMPMVNNCDDYLDCGDDDDEAVRCVIGFKLCNAGLEC